MRLSYTISLLALLALLAGLCARGRDAFAKEKPQVWKSIDDALLRINDSPPKDWTVYQTGKKSEPLLLQLGNRFLLIESRTHRIFELQPSTVEVKPDELLWSPSDKPAEPLPTSDWDLVDNGGAYEISVKLDTEKAAVDLQLPHPEDIGALPVQGPRGGGRRQHP